MSVQGGGFCEIHGPFDPPHLTCPYCVLEQGGVPPASSAPTGMPGEAVTEIGPMDGFDPLPPPSSKPDSEGFVRHTFQAEPVHDVTEVIQRGSLSAGEEAESDFGGPPLLGYLIIKEPPEHRGTCLPIKPNQSIGREGDVRWSDARISRQHARVTAEPPEDDPDGPLTFYLWPFGPTNPVYINGQAVRGATALHENDEIRLGNTLFVLKVLAD